MRAPSRISLPVSLIFFCASCASSPTDLEGWPEATRAIRAALEREMADLERECLLQFDPSAQSSFHAREALEAMQAAARPRLDAWRALEDHCGRLLPVLRESPYDARGVRAVAESWRALIDALPGVSPVSTEQRDETARAMLRANTSAAALQAADGAVAQLGEDLAACHDGLSEKVRAAGRALDLLLREREAEWVARRDALAEIVQAAETELRMEAAGAGVARPGTQATLDANRPELARLEEQLAAGARARAHLAARFEATLGHVRRTGFAAREWAVAQREAGSALQQGLAEANFRLLESSAAELSDAGPDGW